MERVSVDAENICRFTSVPVGVRKHDFKKGFLKYLSGFRYRVHRVARRIPWTVQRVLGATRAPERRGSPVRL